MIELSTRYHSNLVYIYTRFRGAAPSIQAFCHLTFTIAVGSFHESGDELFSLPYGNWLR